jgi:NAD(P)-dependent dehydrogenase (short-subunit alcohol dehydrogenase family)
MDGRTVLITGGNTGLGKETAVALARAGARVLFTTRDAQKGADARAAIRDRGDSDTVEVMELDLARLDSVRVFASEFGERYDHLDVLVNNAGAMLGTRRTTVDGYEMTFQVNHLGPFLLTMLLQAQLAAGDRARVVNVASAAHSGARRGLDFDDLQSTDHYRSYSVYAKSRTEARRARSSSITSTASLPERRRISSRADAPFPASREVNTTVAPS